VGRPTRLRSAEPLPRGGSVKVSEPGEVEEAPGLVSRLRSLERRSRIGSDTARSGSARARGLVGESIRSLAESSSSRRAARVKRPRPERGGFRGVPHHEVARAGDERVLGRFRCSGHCGAKARTLVRRRPARTVSSETRHASTIMKMARADWIPRKWPRVVTSCRSWQARPDGGSTAARKRSR